MKWIDLPILPKEGEYVLVHCPNYCESEYAVASCVNVRGKTSWYTEDGDYQIDPFVVCWTKIDES